MSTVVASVVMDMENAGTLVGVIVVAGAVVVDTEVVVVEMSLVVEVVVVSAMAAATRASPDAARLPGPVAARPIL